MDDKKFFNYSVTQLDKEHVWAFCAGQYSQDFRGNPKYLFLYINRYRPDIYAYWLCSNEKVINQIRSMGYEAFQLGSSRAAAAIDHTGVLVAEQVKAEIPPGLESAKYINLWHGVGGVKAVERSIKKGLLVPEIARKYIRHNEYYRTYQMYLATSPFIEKIAEEQLGLTDSQIIRAGYPRNIYQKYYEKVVTYDHDLIENRSLPSDTRMAVYIPTRREFDNPNFFLDAFPDMDRLVDICEKKHILMIFKMHPYYENDGLFLHTKQLYEDCPWLLFWDNENDFYEIINKVDLCIMDYSSMYTDFILSGCKHFIRYCFDFKSEDLDFPLEYDETTLGEKCFSFDELISAIGNYKKHSYKEEINKIKKIYWEYYTPDSMDKIIESVLSFSPVKPDIPELYSFDIFDTVFSRKVLDPVGVFFYVKEQMEKKGSFPKALVANYPEIRRNTELIIREFYKKSTDIRESDDLEIHYDEIIERIANVYQLDDKQKELIKKWEFEAELDNVIPLTPQIELIKRYLSEGNTVILISDMYLPKDFVVKMLEKADPILSALPLYLSNEYGVLKAHKSLYYEVYNSFEPFYDFKKWVHYGDNPPVDQTAARKCGISTRIVEKPVFNDLQKEMVKRIGTYDAYLVAAMQCRICDKYLSENESFVASFITLLMVPYIDWVIRDALGKKYETLYFVSRDGHPLKRIADAIIKQRKLDIKTKYIYASRRTWRIPSFIQEVDPCFWQSYANFGDLVSKDKLFRAMSLDEETFVKMFPDINPDEIDFFDKKLINNLIERFKMSENYNTYLLNVAEKERELVCGYLEQEIDRNEKFAVVEYWGRGYTQDTMVKLWQYIVGKKVTVPFYYTRTVLPSMGDAVRYNFTTNSAEQFFIEGFFANMPYKSVERYKRVGNRIEPVIEPISYNKGIYDAMQKILPEFATEYSKLDLKNPTDIAHMLYDFSLDYYLDNRENPEFAERIGSMVDSVAAYGKKREFAPALTEDVLKKFAEKNLLRGDSKLSTSITMSIARTEDGLKKKYFDLYQILPGDDILSGRPLTQKEQDSNKSFMNQYYSLLERSKRFRNLYESAIEGSDVSNLILFVVNGKTLDEVDLFELFNRLRQETFYDCESILLGEYKESEDNKIANKIAKARFIIMANPIHIFSELSWRNETEAILLRNVPFSLYNAGLTTYRFLKWEKRLLNQRSKNDITLVQVPSVYSEEVFRKNFCGNRKTSCDLLGSCITDQYFDKTIQNTVKEKLIKIFPEANNKKVIFYMPTLRNRAGNPSWLSMLDMMYLRKDIGNDYVVIINFNKNIKDESYDNIFEIPGFSKLVVTSKKTITIRELIIAADVVVGDYRDSFFETALLRKPMYSTAWDYEEIIKSQNMTNNANNIKDFLFAPIVKNSSELVKQLEKLDSYDYSAIDVFREKYLGGCDGHSCDRVVSYLKDKYLISGKEMEANEKWHEKYLELLEIGDTFRILYEKAVKRKKTAENIIFISEKKSLNNTGLGLLFDKLNDDAKSGDAEKPLLIRINKDDDYSDEKHLKSIATQLAEAKYIILSGDIPLLCRTRFREETRVIMIRDVAYPLFNRKNKKAYKYTWQSEYEVLKSTIHVTDLQIPSKAQEDVYIEKYCNGDREVNTDILGVCLTDLYFDKKFIKKSKEKMIKKYPELADKKLILFIPTIGDFNGTKRNSLPLNLEIMKKELPNDYSVVLNLNKKQKKKLKEEITFPEGFIEIESGFSAKELMVSCDVIVGDYRDTIFEAAILKKPCFSTAYDSQAMIKDSKGGLTEEDLDEATIFPVIKNEKELAVLINNLENYDYKRMTAFCKKYMSGCKGSSVKAVLDSIKKQ